MKTSFIGLTLVLTCLTAFADEPRPVIKDYGYFYNVPAHATIDKETHFKIAFDVGDGADIGEQNNRFNSLARFINMHVAHGVELKNIELALVVHGKATLDLLNNDEYKKRFERDNKNQSLIIQLLENKTLVYVCGQSAMHYKVPNEQLIAGVSMSLSAMTAHAQLQQMGYTLNPF